MIIALPNFIHICLRFHVYRELSLKFPGRQHSITLGWVRSLYSRTIDSSVTRRTPTITCTFSAEDRFDLHTKIAVSRILISSVLTLYCVATLCFTVVMSVDLCDVQEGRSSELSHRVLHVGVLCNDCVPSISWKPEMSLSSESKSHLLSRSIMHHTSNVILLSIRVHILLPDHCEVVKVLRSNPRFHNLHVIVPVVSGLFVEQSQGMCQLMGRDPEHFASYPDVENLCLLSLVPSYSTPASIFLSGHE